MAVSFNMPMNPSFDIYTLTPEYRIHYSGQDFLSRWLRWMKKSHPWVAPSSTLALVPPLHGSSVYRLMRPTCFQCAVCVYIRETD